jgi:purine-nucleoside phosphorylase
VEGHKGKLILGKLSGTNVIAMQGRFHFYEGYSIQEVTMPVRVMKKLGIEQLIISNASGGVNPDYEVGDLMILNDHINLIPSPLIGANLDEFGPRFPDMSDTYDKGMIATALSIGKDNGIRVFEGVYAAVTGPCLETPAEYKYLRIIGSDTVGMSTAPEVIVARHMQIPCFAISVITDLGVEGKIKKVSHEEIQKVAEVAEPKLTLIIEELIKTIS